MKYSEVEEQLQELSPWEGLRLLDAVFGAKAKLSTAMGPEAQLLTYWIAKQKLNTEIFTIDTGRLFQETQDLIELTNQLFDTSIKVYYPDHLAIGRLVSEKGPNSFYHSVEDRIECCKIRKVDPLTQVLAGAKVWITGIRADQSHSRKHMKMVEWNERHQVIKYNPLVNWTSEKVWSLIEKYHIPVNKLHKRGFVSIGCQPCTRAVSEGENERAGRWWWENSHKECGLHLPNPVAA